MSGAPRRTEVHRVFHVPSHLKYASKLAANGFTPVPSPSGAPLRVSDLLALWSWDFFDILHLHTMELATADELVIRETPGDDR